MRLLLIILTGFISILLLLAGAGTLYLANLDLNQHKPYLSAKFQELTGRELTITGDISHTLYPWLSVELKDVTVSNLPEFSDSAFLQSDTASIRLNTMSLFTRDFKITDVHLDNTSLNLEINSDGAVNWAFSPLSESQSHPDSEQPAASSYSVNSLNVAGVKISNLLIGFRDFRTNKQFEISNFNFQTDTLELHKPVTLDMDFDVAINQPEINAKLALQGTMSYSIENRIYDFSALHLQGNITANNLEAEPLELTSKLTLDLDKSTVNISQLSAQGLGASIDGVLSLENLASGQPSFNGKLRIDSPDILPIISLTGDEALQGRLASFSQREFFLESAAQGDLNTGSIQFEQMQLDALGSTLSMQVNIHNARQDDMHISGSLVGNGPDFPLVLELAGLLTGGSTSPLIQTSRQLASLPDQSFSVNARADLDFATGEFQAPDLDASFPGLSVQGSLNGQNMQGSNGFIEGDLHLNAPRAGQLLTALGQEEVGQLITSAALDVSLSGSRQAIIFSPLHADIQINNNGRSLPASIRSQGTLNLDEQTLALEFVQIDGPSIEINTSATITQYETTPIISGKLELPQFNARKFMNQLQIAIPDTSDPATFETAALSTDFNMSGDYLSLENIDAVLDDSHIQGALALPLSQKSDMPYTLDIDIDTLNADRYFSNTTSGHGNSADENTLQNFRTIYAEGKLHITSLIASGLKINDMDLNLVAANGYFTLSPLSAFLYKGKLSGNIILDSGTATPALSLNTTLTDIDIAPLLTDLSGASQLSGIADLSLDLKSTGNTLTQLKQGLNGSGNVFIEEGVFKGVDVGSVLQQLETMLRTEQLTRIQRGNSTPFEQLSGSFTAVNGLVQSNDLLMISPGFRVSGQGTLVNLLDDSINFQLLTSVDKTTAISEEVTYNLGGYDLPIACSGTTYSPSCTPNFEAIISAAIRRSVSRGLGDLLQRALGDQEQETENSPTDSPEDTTQEEPSSRDLLNRSIRELLK